MAPAERRGYLRRPLQGRLATLFCEGRLEISFARLAGTRLRRQSPTAVVAVVIAVGVVVVVVVVVFVAIFPQIA